MNIGIIGIGGLGMMGVKLAKAMGNTVTAISTTPTKRQTALGNRKLKIHVVGLTTVKKGTNRRLLGLTTKN